jgi:hypothetical protein
VDNYNRVRRVAGYYILENVVIEDEGEETYQAVAKFSMNFFNPTMVETICRQMGFPISVTKGEEKVLKSSITHIPL